MKFPTWLESAVNKLRGRHRSIRFRFWEVPKETLKVQLYRLRGRSFIDYYADRLNSMPSEELPPTTSYLDVGTKFLDYLKKQGLRPEHRLLDYGCGILRGGLQFIPYLNPGNYVGVDISEKRLEEGQLLVDQLGIPRSDYSTFLVRDCSMRELGDRKFDYIWANAVLVHMPEHDIKELAVSLKQFMTPGAQFFFTFSEEVEADRPTQDQVRDFYYPTSHLRYIFESAGYDFDVMPDGHDQHAGRPTVRVRLAV